MPIRKEDRPNYPANWSAIRRAILCRAGNRCEGCGVPNHERGIRMPDGAFITLDEAMVKGGFPAGSEQGRPILIVLTIAHKNHNPRDNDNLDLFPPDRELGPELVLKYKDSNLAAWCQRCHNRHDSWYRAKRRREHYKRRESQNE